MGLIRSLFEPREKRLNPGALRGLFGLVAAQSTAGPSVTPGNALTSTAVLSCVRVLAESIASLPLLVYHRRGRAKERATDLPLYELLHDLPNSEMTSFEWRELKMQHVLLWGNAYAEKEYSLGGDLIGLWPLNPAVTEPVRVNGELRYLTQVGNEQITLPAWRVHHLRGLSGDGIRGYSMIRLAMNAIGLGLGMEEFGGRFFANGARPGVVLKHPGVLSDDAYERLKNSWNADHQGLSNAHRVKILEEGLDMETIGIPPEEAQFLESRKFQLQEVARIYRVPPHMLADLDRATFSNIEHLGIEFVTHSLRPWLVRSEQALRRDLLQPEERKTLLIEYLVDGLMRGDIVSRYQAYSVGRQNGWLSANDIRQMENMNPITGGDVYLIPLNMLPIDAAAGASQRQHVDHPDCQCPACRDIAERRAEDDDGAESEPETVKTWRRHKQKLASDYLPLYEDVAGRVVRRECNDIRRAVGKQLRRRSIADFRAWLEEFYSDFADVLIEQFGPLMQTFAAQVVTAVADELDKDDPGMTDEIKSFIADYLATFAAGYVASSQNQILALMADAESEGNDVGDILEQRLDEWEEKKPGKTALRQAFEAMNALSVAQYGIFGILYLRWAARGKSCPYCRRLDGRVVGIKEYFVQSGDSIAGEDGDPPLTVRGKKRYGPLHRGCDCVVVAA
ncbi:MAG: phage portal protein [Nitrospira sp.]